MKTKEMEFRSIRTDVHGVKWYVYKVYRGKQLVFLMETNRSKPSGK